MLNCPTTTASPDKTTPLNAGLHGYPGYPGYGNTTGGRGGQVIAVTNRNDSGAGSLRAALEATGARNVVFKVGGVFTLNSPIVISDPNISVYGLTAPGGGVTVTFLAGHSIDRAPILVSAFDVMLSHIRSRPRPAALADPGTCCVDAISIDGRFAGRVSIIHCSFSFATDENVEAWYGAKGITVAGCIIGQGMRNSTAIDRTDHNYSAIFGNGVGQPYGERVSVYWNLMAHNIGRNPRMGATTEFDVWQNIIYNQLNFGFESEVRTDGLDSTGNIEDNKFIDGPNTPDVPFGGNIRFSINATNADHNAFVSNNKRELESGAIVDAPITGSYNPINRINSPRPNTAIGDFESYVISNAGAKQRDGTDIRIVSEVNSRTGNNRVSCIDGEVETAENNFCEFSVPFLPAANADSQPLLDDTNPDCVPSSFKANDCGIGPNDDSTQFTDSVGYTFFEHYIFKTFLTN